MPKKPKSSSYSRLSPAQLGLFLIVVLAVAIYQYLSQGASSTAPLPPTETSQQQSNVEPDNPPEQPIPPTNTTARPGDQPAADQPATNTSAADTMSEFDYFVLALSWSPDYCATNGSDDPQQCSLGRKLGFVLHGLWPQYNRGYPSNCSTEKMGEEVKAQFPGLYPNENLYDHEWEKHGTCTGLSPVGYLRLSKQFKESVTIPGAFRVPEAPLRMSAGQLKQEFTQANPGFPETAFEVRCSGSGRYLKELFVCFSREGQATACGADVHKDALKSCQRADFVVRNIR